MVLRHKFYDMIASGEKPEEYRNLFIWAHRLLDVNRGNGIFRKAKKCDFDDFLQVTDDGNNEFAWQLRCEIKAQNFAFRKYDYVRFHRGYTSTTMTFDIESISIGQGREEWGAENGKEYFVIKLGKRL